MSSFPMTQTQLQTLFGSLRESSAEAFSWLGMAELFPNTQVVYSDNGQMLSQRAGYSSALSDVLYPAITRPTRIVLDLISPNGSEVRRGLCLYTGKEVNIERMQFDKDQETRLPEPTVKLALHPIQGVSRPRFVECIVEESSLTFRFGDDGTHFYPRADYLIRHGISPTCTYKGPDPAFDTCKSHASTTILGVYQSHGTEDSCTVWQIHKT